MSCFSGSHLWRIRKECAGRRFQDKDVWSLCIGFQGARLFYNYGQAQHTTQDQQSFTAYAVHHTWDGIDQDDESHWRSSQMHRWNVEQQQEPCSYKLLVLCNMLISQNAKFLQQALFRHKQNGKGEWKRKWHHTSKTSRDSKGWSLCKQFLQVCLIQGIQREINMKSL